MSSRRVVHIIGNGSSAAAYKPSKGVKITCNLPPFAIDNVYGTCMVDFKMMNAISSGSVVVPGDWILGARPHHYMNNINHSFKLKYAQQIKEFYLELPSYVSNYTDFNCGHMATHYSANKLKGTEIHMYGFNSLFDYDLKSCTDFYLASDRSDNNNLRLTNNWRPVWNNVFNEFPDTQFVLYHKHDKLSIPKPKNVEIRSF